MRGVVWGRAFLLQGEAALPYLTTRECQLGGYISTITTVYPQPGVDTKPFPALLYLATPNNRPWLGESPQSQVVVSCVCCYRHWLGEAPLHEIACQIMESSGPSGHNVEYLLRLASFMKEQVPEAMDDHLFTLEIMFPQWSRVLSVVVPLSELAEVRSIVKDRNLCLKTLMGELGPRRSPQPPPDQEDHANNAVEVVRPDSFQFTSRVQTKKLRCLNI
uniref:Gamma-glutamylcyclotransferase n=1 Tax=Timema douglasi TaxID=61478 RepID=A0A7R8Z2V6_TIMDO|nr:unnamed protein product [Timema douglasi]